MSETQSNNKDYDFVFGVNIPINKPTQEEIDALSESLEEHLTHLIESEFMTMEEAVAYVKFSTQMSSFVPFMIDGFLKSYRENMRKLEEQSQ